MMMELETAVEDHLGSALGTQMQEDIDVHAFAK